MFTFADDGVTNIPATSYLNQAAALAAEPLLAVFLAAQSALATIIPRGQPIDAAIHLGDIFAGHPTTPTVSGPGIASAIFDGALLTVVYSQERRNADPVSVRLRVPDANVIIATPAVTTTGFTVLLSEGAPATQDATVIIEI